MHLSSGVGRLLEIPLRQNVVDHPHRHGGIGGEPNAVDEEYSGIAGPFGPHRDRRFRGLPMSFIGTMFRLSHYVEAVQEPDEVARGDGRQHIEAAHELTHVSIRPVLR
ncbi:hypothetical protein ABZ946_17485 [Streptomyces sp. NPDC046324]|uniref:hypothetical protein n=1 Tax=Streptomyces sp. NPDC046324 TaxID=3154915 RepID=UPI0033D5391A